MRVRTVTIENFRGIKKAEIRLDDVTVLIGENNTGKTTALDAIRLCLGRQAPRKGSQFEDYDYHLDRPSAEPSGAPPISLTFDFAEDKVDQWPESLVQALGDVVVLHGDDRRHVTLRVTSSFDSTIGDFTSESRFLDAGGQPLRAKGNVLGTLQHLRPVFYLSAVRDAARDFSSRSPFWGPFLRSPKVDEKKRKELEAALGELNDQIISAQAAFADVRRTLGKAPAIVALGEKDTVSIDALPGRIFDLLARTEVSLQSTLGTKLPLGRHGAGTQSLSVMLLFEAFLQSRLKEAYDPLSEPVLALEEPEAHLHPCAIRALWASLGQLSGQILVSTHSGDLLGEVPLSAIRRFHRRGGNIEVRQLGPTTLDENDKQRLEVYVRDSRGELLFARLWFLVEGQTEYWVLTMLAEMFGIHLAKYGVRIVQYQTASVLPFVKLANDLGIDWVCLVDGDSMGAANKKAVSAHLGGKKVAERVLELPAANMELFLCEAGFGTTYEAHISPQKKSKVTAKKGDPKYWPQVLDALSNRPGKEWHAIQAMTEMKKGGTAVVPQFLKQIVGLIQSVGMG